MESTNSIAQSTGETVIATDDTTMNEAAAAASKHSTGHPRVDEQLRTLDSIAARPVSEHVSIFEDVHRALGDVLRTIDTDSQTENATGNGDPVPGRE
ncbi:MAG TPA: hypothetical protein VHU91_10915 [Mycobacteriales bacterium]|jgi:hypothetical protein|nr:hypothetical protein [Mycobacteriales bacterium]